MDFIVYSPFFFTLGKSFTNNSLESMHADFKSTYTNNTKLRTGAFLDVAGRLICDYTAKAKADDWSWPLPNRELWKKIKGSR
jgi:hypothetical protein